MIEGGIAGTVNLRTHVPFDSEGFVRAFSREMGYGTSRRGQAAGSILVSNRWDTGVGEFGVMANAAYSERCHTIAGRAGAALLQVHRRGGVRRRHQWIPIGADIRQNTYDRTRKGCRWPVSTAAPKTRC
jgi:hypothetical protein